MEGLVAVDQVIGIAISQLIKLAESELGLGDQKVSRMAHSGLLAH